MKFCSLCGHELPRDAKFCPECGAKADRSVSREGNQTIPARSGFGLGSDSVTSVLPQPFTPAFGGSDPAEDLERVVRGMLAEGEPYAKIAAVLEKRVSNLRGGGKGAADCVRSMFLRPGFAETEPFFLWLIARYEGRTEKGGTE